MSARGQQAPEPPSNAQAVLTHHASVVRGEVDARSDGSINAYLLASAASEARAGIEARLADMPNDPYGEAVWVEWTCWDPGTHEEGRSAAKTWLIEHNDPGLTGYVQARADFLTARSTHIEAIDSAASVALWFPWLATLVAVGLAWCGQRSLARLLA